MQRMQRLAALVGIALVLAGCTARGTLPSAQLPLPKVPGAQTMATATFVMHWPTTPATSSSIKRHPLFTSPSTQSVNVQVNSLTPAVVNRTAGVPTSNITIAAPVGNDIFSIKLYDQDNATGNLLGETAVSKTIVANTANTVSATVNGVVAKIFFGEIFDTFVEGNAISGFVLVGGSPQIFFAVPEDADGNVIVSPGVVPKITLTSGSRALTVSTTATPNQFTLQAVAAVTGPITLLATSGGVSATFSITESAALYVPNFNNNTVTVYDQSGNQIAVGAFLSLNKPTSIAFDPANGQLYVTNSGNNTITVYDQNGNKIATSGTFPNLASPMSIAFDPANDQLYVINLDTVTVYDQNGNQITTSGTFPNLALPTGIAFDPANGELYVTNSGNNTVSVYDQSGHQITTIGAFPNLNGPVGVAFDPVNAQLYVTNPQPAPAGSTLTIYDQNGDQITTSGTFPSLEFPFGIAFDPANGELYVSNLANNTVTVYDQNGNEIGTSGNFPNLSSPRLLVAVP